MHCRFLVGVITFAVLFCCNFTEAGTCPGCVDLDDINFDKTIARFPYALVKFDIAYPYGEKHEAFADFSKAAHKVTDQLLVATVGIKDYGENENKALGDRFGVDEKKFPGIFLFQGSADKYLKLPDHLDVTLNNLKAFVTKNTELYIGPDGCLKEFNELARNFANLDESGRSERLAEAEKLAKDLQQPQEQASAKVYLSFMKKINEIGYDFVEEETTRLLRLKAGKVSDAKKVEFTRRLNILDSFRVTKLVQNTKEEL